MEVRQKNVIQNKQNWQALILIKIYREKGFTYQKIADELNEGGYITRNGKHFLKGSVHHLLRIGK